MKILRLKERKYAWLKLGGVYCRMKILRLKERKYAWLKLGGGA